MGPTVPQKDMVSTCLNLFRLLKKTQKNKKKQAGTGQTVAMQNHTKDNTMNNINYHKNSSPPSCPQRGGRDTEADREKMKLRGGEREKERNKKK